MIYVTIDDKAVRELARAFPRHVQRAAEIALDRTADATKIAEQAEMRRVFDRPVPYTLNSLKATKTKNHQLVAFVWFKDPGVIKRAHYLIPQILGGGRPLKKFETRLDNSYFAPSKTELNSYGNLPMGRIVQILSVLKRAENSSGYSANITARSAKRNRKDRDYFLLKKRHGRLAPGVYQRVQSGPGFGAKTKKTLPFGTWQRGQTRGRFSSVIRARNLKAILFKIKRPSYSKRFAFYEIANKVMHAAMIPEFKRQLSARMRIVR